VVLPGTEKLVRRNLKLSQRLGNLYRLYQIFSLIMAENVVQLLHHFEDIT